MTPRPHRNITISKLARAGGVGVETVRYYQRRGLMSVPRPHGASPYRAYAAEDVQRLRFIRRAQTAGFTLDEIGQLLALDRTAQRSRVQALAATRLVALEEQFVQIEAARRALTTLLTACREGAPGPCPIIGAFVVDGRPRRARQDPTGERRPYRPSRVRGAVPHGPASSCGCGSCDCAPCRCSEA